MAMKIFHTASGLKLTQTQTLVILEQKTMINKVVNKIKAASVTDLTIYPMASTIIRAQLQSGQ